ncbi:MAG: NADH-quinone oxidoreductase subunit L, partial [Verrucomicrobiales bacterium]
PLISALVILLGTRKSGSLSATVSVGSVLITLGCSIAMLFGAGEAASLTWMRIGDLSINFGIEIDSKTRSMMFIVTFIGALVHIFSLQYMKDDDAKARFFGGLSLFMFSMTGIVLADNFAMMFIFWELVGVSSYLLIGHWYQKNSAADAAKKAFLMNRIGDFGFMIGILILFGLTGSLSFSDINNGLEIAEGASESKQAGLLTLATLCIFCGAIGKSAQFPLHTWLPDAMEGPTPVSALIHAATMVAAGVYMLVKVSFLLYAAPLAAEVISYIGCLTALIAALIATQQNDIKKVLAYSTLSQLGYMVMAVGFVGMGEFNKQGPDANVFDPANAAYFHLYTHAFFKALLFLGSGAVIYACHHQQDIWKMGGLKKKMPITTATFAIGTAALLGIVFTSGFYSKDSVLAAVYSKPHVFIPALFTVFLTAFYMTRLFVVAFLGEPKSEDADHAKEVPPIMFAPLVLLAIFSICAGWPFVTKMFGFDNHHIPHPHGPLIPALASAMGLAGIGFGILLYSGKEKDPISIPLLANKFGFDELYAGIVRIFQDTVAYVAKALDQIFIDGLLVRGIAAITAGTGSMLRRLQVGNLQGYAFLFGLGVIAIIYFLIISA